jgi:hypothetical protein
MGRHSLPVLVALALVPAAGFGQPPPADVKAQKAQAAIALHDEALVMVKDLL